MRTRLIVGTAVLVVLIPQAASAICLGHPFDDVVRSSDSVLVATVAEAAPRGKHETGIIVRLDVEQVLKGSAEDGRSVRIQSCGPAMVGPMADLAAHEMIGTRGLFLLSTSEGDPASQYPEITTPQMTLDQKIAEAGRVLGLSAAPHDADEGGLTSSWARISEVGLAVIAIVLVIAGVTIVRGRARRS